MTTSCVWNLYIMETLVNGGWDDAKKGALQWKYHVIKNGGAELSILDNVYITRGIVGYTQTNDLLCKTRVRILSMFLAVTG